METISKKNRIGKSQKPEIEAVFPDLSTDTIEQWVTAGDERHSATLRRLNIVMRLLVDGYSPLQIWEKINHEQGWQVSYVVITKYYNAAKQLIAKMMDKDRESNIAVMVQRFNEIYRQARVEKRYMAAIAAQRELAKILGLYAPVRVDISGEVRLTKKDKEDLNDISDFILPDAVLQPVIDAERFEADGVLDAGLDAVLQVEPDAAQSGTGVASDISAELMELDNEESDGGGMAGETDDR